MAGLAGALYGTVNGSSATTDFDFFPGIIFVLFVTIWSIRTVSGAFLAAADLRALTSFWQTGIGLFAGVGIILIGRAASGILGIEALHFRLPWVKRGRGGQPTPAPTGPPRDRGGTGRCAGGGHAVPPG